MVLLQQSTNADQEIGQYLQDLTHIKALESEEERQLIEHIANATMTADHARMRLIEGYLGLVVDLARHYQPFGIELPDLIQEGNVALVEAAQGFDPHHSPSFRAFVTQMVCQRLAHVVKQQGGFSSPEPFTSAILHRVTDVSLVHKSSGPKRRLFLMHEEDETASDWNSISALPDLTGRGDFSPTQDIRQTAQPQGVGPRDLDIWLPLLRFLQATGLRRSELKSLTVGDLKQYDHHIGRPAVKVHGQSGRTRIVPILPGCEQDILPLLPNRADTERVFPRIPRHIDIRRYRREYAQALYLTLAPGWNLPPKTGRLPRNGYHRQAARIVTRALGHHRISVLSHYLR